MAAVIRYIPAVIQYIPAGGDFVWGNPAMFSDVIKEILCAVVFMTCIDDTV
jgi:hypothetical protein